MQFTDDAQRVQGFLEEFSSNLGETFEKGIDFIILFGSAARGEWIRGVSDVDMIIQVVKQDHINAIKEYAEKLFWKLDEKYDTQFKTACSTGDDKDRVKKILKKTKLYVPFDVFGPWDLDWEKGKIKKKELLLGANLIASQAILFKKLKHEGVILYGRDVRKDIQFKPSWWEKFKALMIPFYMSLISSLTAFLLPLFSVKFANKAVIYSIESTLFFMDRPVGGGMKRAISQWEEELKKNRKLNKRLFDFMEIDLVLNFDYNSLLNFDFAKRALSLKYYWKDEKERFGRISALKFCLKSLFFINNMNWYAILKTDSNKYILKTLIVSRVLFVVAVFWYVFIR